MATFGATIHTNLLAFRWLWYIFISSEYLHLLSEALSRAASVG